MLKKTAAFFSVLILAFLLQSVGSAQTPQSATAPQPEKRKPIVSKWTTLDGMRYYYAGVKVADDDSLKNLISPLKDPEANRLLDVSSGSHTAGVVFLVGGTACLIGGLSMAGGNYDSNSQSFNSTGTAGLVVALVGLVGDYVGVFKLEESMTSKFAAVQRYNALVRGEDEAVTSWNLPKAGIQTDLLTFKF